MRLVQKSQAGDTIVEVLLALAIIGLVLGAAYGTAERSIRVVRQSHERSEALKVGENQIETIKSRTSDSDPVVRGEIFSTSEDFCIAIDGSLQQFPAGFSLRDYIDIGATGTPEDFSAQYPANCQIGGLYFVNVQYDSSQDRFTVTTRWDRIGGGVDESVLYYSSHEVIN